MKNPFPILPLIAIISCTTLQSQNPPLTYKILDGEQWSSGVVNQAPNMPYDQNTVYHFQMLGDVDGNQAQPLLISNKGRYVWSEAPFEFRFNRGVLQINGSAKIDTGTAGKTLREVQRYVRATYFPASGQLPNLELFAHPQYNTWIELNYNQNQADVLKYAHAILDNGFPAGVLMIDDTWQENYGVWDFHPRRFPRPKEMIDELHRLGFKVMVWICPFVSPDSKEFRELEKQRALVEKDAASRDPLIVHWWNGYSAELDFSNPDAVRWFRGRLDFLQRQYGVDGFKFDAGDPEYYPAGSVAKEKITANRHTELYAQIGLSYPLNEYRACWKMGGQSLVQRLRDKAHSWEDLQKLIPGMALAGLTGYTFSCPDMIGGGEIGSFWDAADNLDQDLVVRSAQCSAFMPMMQFSVAPWRILDSAHLDAVKKAVALRARFTPLILRLARASARTGEPILKSMDYVFPNQGFEKTTNQFMLGDSVMVAPMVTKGTARTVHFPLLKNGRWKGEDGKFYQSGDLAKMNVGIERLEYFKKENKE